MKRRVAASRRTFLKRALAACAVLVPLPAIAQAAPRVVVVGGGFAGATCAGTLRRLDAKLNVVLVETNPTFTACPFSNGVIAGMRELRAQQFNYEALGGLGVTLAFMPATRVDPQARTVTLNGGTNLPFDLHPDGKRIAGIADAGQGSADKVVLVENFFEYLKATVPGAKR